MVSVTNAKCGSNHPSARKRSKYCCKFNLASQTYTSWSDLTEALLDATADAAPTWLCTSGAAVGPSIATLVEFFFCHGHMHSFVSTWNAEATILITPYSYLRMTTMSNEVLFNLRNVCALRKRACLLADSLMNAEIFKLWKYVGMSSEKYTLIHVYQDNAERPESRPAWFACGYRLQCVLLKRSQLIVFVCCCDNYIRFWCNANDVICRRTRALVGCMRDQFRQVSSVVALLVAAWLRSWMNVRWFISL